MPPTPPESEWLFPPFEPLPLLPGDALAPADPARANAGGPGRLLDEPRGLRNLSGMEESDQAALDSNLRLPLAGSFFAFGQFGAKDDPAIVPKRTLEGRTGLGCKLPLSLPAGLEVSVRSGPSVSWTATHNTARLPEHVPVFVEMQCRYPLLGAASLEYVGSAFPALDPSEHDKVNQDLHLSFPLATDWQLHIGAKHSWENLAESQQPWTTSLQFYLGTGMKW